MANVVPGEEVAGAMNAEYYLGRKLWECVAYSTYAECSVRFESAMESLECSAVQVMVAAGLMKDRGHHTTMRGRRIA